MIGHTRSRVRSGMNKFRKLGFIHYNGDGVESQFIVECCSHEEPHIETEQIET